MPRPHLYLLPLLGLSTACSSDACPKGSEMRGDGLCYLIDSAPDGEGSGDDGTPDDTADPGDSGGTGDSGDSGGTTDSGGSGSSGGDYAYGDPIEVLGTYGEGGGEGMPILYEWTDAAAIDDDYAIVTGQGGYGIIDMADGNLLYQERTRRALRVATDGQHAILASRTDGFQLVDIRGADTRGSRDFFAPPSSVAHEDVDLEGELVVVGWRSEGLMLLDLEGNVVSNTPASDAFAVSIEGERLAYTDGPELVLLDISTPSAPVELDRQAMSGDGRDMSWKGDHLVVGMGGVGTGVWAVQSDQLVHRGDVRSPGSALSVAVDGDHAWIGAWQTTALVDLSAEPPIILGHQAPEDSAMGVGASGGRAVVADWFHSTALAVVPGVAGPEIEAPEAAYFDPSGASTQVVYFENHGPIDLDITFDTALGDYEIDRSSLTVAPGDRGLASVSWPLDSRPGARVLNWSSNDPDESSGTVTLKGADQGVGTEHEDFTVPGIQLPENVESTWTLSEARGKVVVLVYWALF